MRIVSPGCVAWLSTVGRHVLPWGVLWGVGLGGGTADAQVVPHFVDVTEASGIRFQHISGPADRKDYIFEAKGGGVGFFDYDNDGWLDVYLVQGSTVERARAQQSPIGALYHNRGDGTFEEVTAASGLAKNVWGMGVTFGDYDNDGWVDLYLTQLGPNLLFRNNGDGTFSDVTAAAGVGDSRWSTSAAFGDYDRDGDLDLYVANYIDHSWENLPPKSDACSYLGRNVMCGPRGLPGAADVLYRNNGDGTFTDVTESSGAVDRDRYYGLGVLWTDLDNDGDLDIYVADDATPNLLFVNQGDGTFEEMGLLSGLAVNGDGSMQASMGVDAADYDNDGLLDVFATHFASDFSTLYHNLGDLIFKDVTAETQIQKTEWLLVSWSTRFMDVDLDGWKDIVHVNGHVYPFLLDGMARERYAQKPSLYLNLRNGTFEEVGAQAGEGFQEKLVSRGAAFGDYDNDGDLDILIANLNDRAVLLRCDQRGGNHWVMFRLEGAGHREAIGARITVVTGEQRQTWEVRRSVGIYSASDPRAHFGLGLSTRIDRVEITWPSGRRQQFENVEADHHYLIQESGGIGLEEFRRP